MWVGLVQSGDSHRREDVGSLRKKDFGLKTATQKPAWIPSLLWPALPCGFWTQDFNINFYLSLQPTGLLTNFGLASPQICVQLLKKKISQYLSLYTSYRFYFSGEHWLIQDGWEVRNSLKKEVLPEPGLPRGHPCQSVTSHRIGTPSAEMHCHATEAAGCSLGDWQELCSSDATWEHWGHAVGALVLGREKPRVFGEVEAVGGEHGRRAL